jgi:hypothetical protein
MRCGRKLVSIRPRWTRRRATGFANGAFEELDEDVPAVVEEFFPDEQGCAAKPNGAAPKGLSGRLQEKVAIASAG